MVETTNGDYWLFIGGMDMKTRKRHNFVHVYNVRKHQLSRSCIRVPYESCINPAMITRNDNNDNLLTFGFINDCYKNQEFKDVQVLPFYLIKFISNWVYFETIHLIHCPKHWTIDVDDVIKSTL